MKKTALETLDLLFYLNYRQKDRELGYMLLFLVAVMLATGLLLTLSGFGLDLIGTLNAAYPFDVTDSSRSFFNKRSGDTVLFAFPVSFLFCLVFYSKGRVNKLIAEYDALRIKDSKFVTASYSAILLGGLLLVGVLFRRLPEFTLFAQLAFIGSLHFLLAGHLISWLRRPPRDKGPERDNQIRGQSNFPFETEQDKGPE